MSVDKLSVASANSKHVHLAFNIDTRGKYSKTLDNINADGRTSGSDDKIDGLSLSFDWYPTLDMLIVYYSNFTQLILMPDK